MYRQSATSAELKTLPFSSPLFVGQYQHNILAEIHCFLRLVGAGRAATPLLVRGLLGLSLATALRYSSELRSVRKELGNIVRLSGLVLIGWSCLGAPKQSELSARPLCGTFF